MELYDFLLSTIREKTFFLAVVSYLIVLSISCLPNKNLTPRERRRYYWIYNLMYKITISLYRLIFIYLLFNNACIMEKRNIMQVFECFRYTHITSFIFSSSIYIYFSELSNFLAFAVVGRTMTMRRFLHMSCNLLLILHFIYGSSNLALIFLLLNYVIGTIQDLLSLLFWTSCISTIFYVYIIPSSLWLVMSISFSFCNTVGDLIVPLLITMFKTFDGFIYIGKNTKRVGVYLC